MATSYTDTVNAFYLAYYGRPADPAGLAFWVGSLEKSKGDVNAISTAFATSAEATSRFGSATVSDRITEIYQQLFNRAPDKAGLDYWVNAVSKGQVSLANAALDIMHGAQTADATLSTLRQQVAAQFTAEVAASGVAYDGNAAVAAARVLISAVTADTKPADITTLVKASASLVQTAHDNPAVISALANGGDLSSLLSTASGKSDPVGMVQALASLGKAALTDSAGLSTLLNGGGVAGLLNSLPAGTSLQDVTTAVNNGGLAAGTVVVNPPVVTVPAVVIAPTIAFTGVDGKDLPADTTLVANSYWYFVAIHDRPSGASTTTFQISTNGSDWKTVAEDDELADGSYSIRYIITDAAGNSGTSNALKLVMDHSVAYPNVQLMLDSGTSAGDRITNNGQVKIGGLHPNEAWAYSFDGKTWTAGTSDAKGAGTIAASAGDGVKNLQIRTLEKVDGKSQFTSTAFKYTLDTSAPGQGLKLASIEGAAAGSTHTEVAQADVVFSYTGTIDLTKGEALFYRINSNDWSRADNTIIDSVNKTVTFKDVDTSHGPVQIVLQTKDTAGNVLDLNVTVDGPKDVTPPVAPTVALVADTGSSATDHLTNNGAIKISGLETGATWEYSYDNGAHWATGPAASQGTATLSTGASGDLTLQVRSTDTSGNVSAVSTLKYTVQPYAIATMNLVGNFNSDVSTNNKGLAFQLDLRGHVADTTTYQISSTGKVADFVAWDATKPLADGTYTFRAVGTDTAGNAYTTNSVTVHLDNVAPAAPTGLQLVKDTGIDGDGITSNGSFTVSGLQKDVLWQYSGDGKTWYQGQPAGDDGIATGYAMDGAQTLQVRTYDLAGNTSDSLTLKITVDYHRPADGLKLDHIGPNGAVGDNHTALPQADLVFKYTGEIKAGDVFEYNTDNTIDAKWTAIGAGQIDTVAKTITIPGIDLSTADAFITIRGSNAAGTQAYYQQSIDGPFTSYSTAPSSAGLNVMLHSQTAHLYVTDGSNPAVQLHSTNDSGDLVAGQWVTFSAQATVVKGVLGVGYDAAGQTLQTGTYAFGTVGADTLSGTQVFGFGGDDIITATGTAAYRSSTIAGGAGADIIHTETSSSEILFGAQDSVVVAGSGVAHGYDTVFTSTGASSSFTEIFTFANTPLGDFYKLTGAQFDAAASGDALLASLNLAVASSFKADIAGQLALISAGVDDSGSAINFLVVDTDKDGHIGSADVVVKIVGSVEGSGAYTSNGSGSFSFNTHVTVL